MLYKTLNTVGAFVYGLNTITDAMSYNASATDTPSAPWSCSDATYADTCNFRCDMQTWSQSIHCGSAHRCNLYVEQKQCFKDSIINATAANKLYVYAGTAQQPYQHATFLLPSMDNGVASNAYFFPDANSNNPYESITLEAGAHTWRINMDCTGGTKGKDNCKKAVINAQSARILYIKSQGTMFNGQDTNNPITVNCPQNSAYVGSMPAPCYIDATNGGSVANVIVHALYGQPHDVYIDVDDPLTDLTNVHLTCSPDLDPQQNGNWDEWMFDPEWRVCFNSKTPTRSPTAVPSAAPTKTPTASPTRVPTTTPSKNPTHSPTKVPTKSPTHDPTTLPSDNPTGNPTYHPTKSPTDQPSADPTVVPTKYPSVVATRYPTHTTEEERNDSSMLHLDANALTIILVMLVGLAGGTLAVCAICFCLRYKQKVNIERAVSLGQVSKRSQLRLDAEGHSNVVPVQKQDDDDTVAAAPANSVMHAAAAHLGEEHGGVVVIRVNSKSRTSVPLQHDNSMGVLHHFDVKQNAVERVPDAKEEDHVADDMMAIQDVTAGDASSLAADHVMAANSLNSDIEILDGVTYGAD